MQASYCFEVMVKQKYMKLDFAAWWILYEILSTRGYWDVDSETGCSIEWEVTHGCDWGKCYLLSPLVQLLNEEVNVLAI